ncbi:DNA polymerase subunit beta [Georgenia sp. SYP-B2076]|uniref:DNA polymerase subunit beta n=1 Tax=Georgenia sp. SYP-B2076 TaxID=2495881 RepID=UPI000F8D4AC8|nr:DNA polymerase subunit beta [Georgenia sp. SYP-B2076]
MDGASLDGEVLAAVAGRLTAVDGVVGVTRAGGRPRDDHHPDSDVELGLYYRAPLDVGALGVVARDVYGPGAEVSAPGEWGPWVDGGAWLRVKGVALDWTYRDLDRVRSAWEGAQRGVFAFHAEVGHPFGVPDFAYAGELALAVVLADPTGELAALKDEFQEYPPALRRALADCLGEAVLLVEVALKAVPRRDTTYVAGCLFRAFTLCAHAIHGHAGHWLVDEKGAITAADRLPGAPEGFSARAHGILSALGMAAEPLEVAVDSGLVLVRDVIKRLR